MGNFIMISQMLLCLSLIVLLHEFGHFITAKMFGMRVEKFSLGFSPKIFSFRRGETEYELGALFLGGYVKISGMIDESFDNEHIKEEPKDYEFRAKPAWQRLIVMIAGVTINVITGILMFIGVVYFWGESYLPTKEVNKYGIVAYPLAQEIGLRTGDKIIKINGQKYDRFEDVLSAKTLLESNSSFTVLRDEKEILIKIPNDLVEKLSSRKNDPKRFLGAIEPFLVGRVMVDKPGAKAGLKEGDKILAVNGVQVNYFHEFEAEKLKTKNKAIKLDIQRGAEKLTLTVTPDEKGAIGFYPKSLLNASRIEFSILESATKGTELAFGSVVNNIKGFGKLFRGEVSTKSLSGPIGIATMFPQTWDWRFFWTITGVLSMWLAFVNMLPIPVLDGGHVLFILMEIISGRRLPDKFLITTQMIGFILIITLMAFIIGNDLFNLIF